MIEIRIHGRGGQGAVTSAELVAQAAIAEGKFAQAFPSCRPERRGAPVVAFCRVDAENRIRLRTNIYNPDIVMVLEHSILKLVNVAAGMKENSILIANTKQSPESIQKELGIGFKVATVDATRIALETIGVRITNTTMLGAMIKATGTVNIDSLTEPLHHRFGKFHQKNMDALKKAFEETQVL